MRMSFVYFLIFIILPFTVSAEAASQSQIQPEHVNAENSILLPSIIGFIAAIVGASISSLVNFLINTRVRRRMDVLATLRQLRTQIMLDAYRRLRNIPRNNHISAFANYAGGSLVDIQLLGTMEQAELAKVLTGKISNAVFNENYKLTRQDLVPDLNKLLTNVRKLLREELNLEEIKGDVLSASTLGQQADILRGRSGEVLAPNVAGSIVGYTWDLDKTQHIVYADKDGKLHELWFGGTQWHHTPLTDTVNDGIRSK